MNISYNWLKDLIDTGLDAEETARELTRVGLAVEGVHPHGNDHVLDIDLTSNRPDCLSHLGVARELAVITGAETRALASVAGADSEPSSKANLVTIEDPDLCHRFTARIIRNVKIGPSPQWLVDRLEAVGERSINNVADITNYVMLELGQPMHAFDLDKLAEGRIVARRAHKGESLTTLDEVDRELDHSILAICDAEKPAAIGGIMGGIASGITESTVNVLLEVAYFNRANIRASSRQLDLATEASYRFERGVDINNLKSASDRAAQLIVELSGGEIGEFVDIYPTKRDPVEVTSPDLAASVKRLTGLDVEQAECDRILNDLGIARRDNTDIYVAPSWRHDVSIEEDLVEEVARHAGYEKIADELPPAYGAGEYQPNEHRERQLRLRLAALGFDEAISYSFIDTKHDAIYASAPGVIDDISEEKFVTLRDAVIEGAVRMRPTMLPGLLDAVRLNLNFQRRDIKLFELGKVFAASAGEDPLPVEQELFALALTGGVIEEGRSMPVRQLDLYDAKGAVEVALEAVGLTSVQFHANDEVRHLQPGQSAEISINGKTLGSLGRLAEDIAASYKFRQPVYVAELNIQQALELSIDTPAYRPLAKYPAVVRDVSFLAERSISYAAIASTVREFGSDLCRNVSFVDVYEGKGLAPNERSITLRFEYRSDVRTLIEEEVESVHQQILAFVEQKLNVKLRV